MVIASAGEPVDRLLPLADPADPVMLSAADRIPVAQVIGEPAYLLTADPKLQPHPEPATLIGR